MIVTLRGGRTSGGESGLTSRLYSNFQWSSADCSDHGLTYEGLIFLWNMSIEIAQQNVLDHLNYGKRACDLSPVSINIYPWSLLETCSQPSPNTRQRHFSPSWGRPYWPFVQSDIIKIHEGVCWSGPILEKTRQQQFQYSTMSHGIQ